MESRLNTYRITPRVVKRGADSLILVEGLDDSTRFYDHLEYEVKITERDGYSFLGEFSIPPIVDTEGKIFRTKSDGGVIKINHKFDSYGLYYIQITALEQKPTVGARTRYQPPSIRRDEVLFSVFSLENELYGRLPYKGDMHMHTYGSDGEESPALMAARYRKYGYDYISITDHFTMEPSIEAIEIFKSIPTEFRIFPGEEVHIPVGALNTFHIVSFNAKSSVNKMLEDNYDAIEATVRKRAEELTSETVDKADAILVAWYEWVHKKINDCGGIMIYPHPYWEVLKRYNIRESTTREIYKRGLTDVIEIFGGTSPENNRMQAQLYYKMREEGYRYPIVASSDAHQTVDDKKFLKLWTITFAKGSEDIPEAVRTGMSVAVEALGSDKTVYGDLPLVQFAWFLINEYYPRHEELCNAAGQAAERFVLGSKEQKKLIDLLENEIKKYSRDFFKSPTK